MHLSLPADVLELGSAGCEPPDRTSVREPNLEPLLASVVTISPAEPSPAQIHFTNEQTEPFDKKKKIAVEVKFELMS